jgi:ABC-type multidrug transport system ATPase subunit
MPAIEIKGVSKNYGKVAAIRGVNLMVEYGQIFGLIGPDGAGKTSLIRILATLLNPTEGKVRVADLDVVSNFREVREAIGYMPGRFSLYSDLTVRENLEFFAGIFGTTINENYYLIKDIYSLLEPFKNRLAGQLSGGMKQKLALSCALIHKPKVLLLDEPTTGVDAVSRKEFWEMLLRLKHEGITIFVSTPYMDEATLCDSIALIQSGKILKVDTPSTIIKQYPFQLFSVSYPNAQSLLEPLRKLNFTVSAYMFGHSIHLAVDNQDITITELTAAIENLGFEGVQIENNMATVEDCFMELLR